MNPTRYRLALTAAACLVFVSALEAKPAIVILIRHAEKPDDENDNHLSLKGKERAAALAPYFIESEELPMIGNLAAIYAQKPVNRKSSLRPIETVQPLADARKLKVLTPFERDDYKSLAKEILQNPEYEGKTVIVCWEHHVLAEIAKKFGPEKPPAEYPGKAFDRTWIIKFHSDGKVTFKDIPQRLMFKDSQD